ncbi:ferredoxin [Nigerium massiliense]|uniref:ferredoxin n=1 Tax=Nigerium massiliense TaxID=1522317 RepID=UPI00058E187B|nr:ferredoxin [Nigerium massiliense]
MSRGRQPHAALHIDWTRCEGRGVCIELLEGVLVADEDGFPKAAGQPAAGRTDVPLARKDEAFAREAVAACPRLALQLRSV